MPIYPTSFSPLSFQQAAPEVTGMQSGLSMAGQQLQNQLQAANLQYAQPILQQTLAQKLLENQKLQQTLPYAGPQAAAQLGLTGAQAQEARGRGSMFGAEANQIGQMTPFEVAKAQAGVYSDPILARMQQISMATGKPIQQVLMESGLVGGQQQPMPPQIQNASPTGIPFLTAAQRAQNYPVLPGGLTAAQQPQVQQALGGAPMQVTPSTAPRLFGGDSMQNYLMFGSPFNPIQYNALLKGSQTQATEGVEQYNKALNDAADTSNDATSMEQFVDQFKDAYKDSSYKGATLGSVPSKGWSTAFVPGDLTPEQKADTAAQNMQQLVLKLMKTNRLTNYELNFAGNLKLNRQMTPQMVNQWGSFMSATANRLNEYQDFLNAARAQNVPLQSANSLWQLYRNQRPVFDIPSKTANTEYNGTWRDYLTPQAVNSVQNGQIFVPNMSKLNKKDLSYLRPEELMAVRNQLGSNQ